MWLTAIWIGLPVKHRDPAFVTRVVRAGAGSTSYERDPPIQSNSPPLPPTILEHWVQHSL